MSDVFALPLRALISDSGVTEAGGKGSGLFRAEAGGFRIPGTMVVPASVFRGVFGTPQFVAVWRETADLVQVAGSVSVVMDAAGRLASKAALLLNDLSCERLLSDIPAEDTWNKLVIRSSADLEDGTDASFAGQLVSVPGVSKQPASILAAIKAAWLAPFQAPFLKYCAARNIDPTTVRLALLIQPQIVALWSGIAFSQNPLSAGESVVVEGVPGLSTTPQRWEVPISSLAYESHDLQNCYSMRLPSEHLHEAGSQKPEVRSQKPAAGSQRHSMRFPPERAQRDFLGESISPREVGGVVGKADVFGENRLNPVARAVSTLAEILECPADVEWAFDSEGLVILQVRPVTAMISTPSPEIHWSRKLTAERYPFPLSPLGWSNIREVFDQGVRAFADFMGMPIPAGEQLACSVDGWIFANEAAFDFKSRFKIRLTRREQLSLFRELLCALTSGKGFMKNIRELKKFATRPAQFITRLGNRIESPVLTLAGGAVQRFLERIGGEVRSAWPGVLSRFKTQVSEITQRIKNAETISELLSEGDRLRTEMILYIKPDLVIFAIREIASMMLVELSRLAGMPDPARIPALLGSGLEHNATLEFHRRVRSLRFIVRDLPGDEPSEWPSQAQDSLKDFLSEFGHLAPGWDLRQPTWGEDPRSFIHFLRSSESGSAHDLHDGERLPPAQWMAHSGGSGTDPLFVVGKTVAKAASQSASQSVSQSVSKIVSQSASETASQGASEAASMAASEAASEAASKIASQSTSEASSKTASKIAWENLETGLFESSNARNLADFLTETLRTFLTIDEEHHFFTGLAIPPTRLLIAKLAKELVSRGCFSDPEDIFWLTDPEVREVLFQKHPKHLRGLVALRKRAFERACRVGPPRMGDVPSSLSSSNVWCGLAASPGIAGGPARKLADADDLNDVRAGDILVLRSPDPFFAVAFPFAAGIAAETGALLSHGAVAAREYGLPAVLSIPGLWDLVKNGQQLDVDGFRGTVSAAKEAKSDA